MKTNNAIKTFCNVGGIGTAIAGTVMMTAGVVTKKSSLVKEGIGMLITSIGFMYDPSKQVLHKAMFLRGCYRKSTLKKRI